MADWTASGAIVALCVFVAGLFINENHRIRKRNEEVIDDIYPSLIADINESMHNYEMLNKNPNTSYNNFLELRNLRKNHKIIKIDKVNKKVYEYLIKVENEIIPILVEHDEMKRKVYKEILDNWIKYLNSLPHINYRHESIAIELYNQTQMNFFDDDYIRLLYEAYHKTMENIIHTNPNANITYFPDGTVVALVKIVEDDIKPLKELDKQIRQLFTSIIKEKLLPEMDKDIEKTGK